MATERQYELPPAERDRLITELRAKGWTFEAIGRRVRMAKGGVKNAIERIKRGGTGRPRRE